ncbi:RNA-splicing factor [Savitreella phatthalungensis]
MSYNGIGLTTPRGSGTSGHVQRNASSIRHKEAFAADIRKTGSHKLHRSKVHAAVSEHEKKRLLQAKILEVRIRMEGRREDEIELEITRLRQGEDGYCGSSDRRSTQGSPRKRSRSLDRALDRQLDQDFHRPHASRAK